MEEILSASDKADFGDFYEILGCHPSSSIEQINTEYKLKALKYHPDKNEGDVEATQKFTLLQMAKDVLTNPQDRKDYDLWRASGLGFSYNKWRAMRKSTKMSMHWADRTTTGMITGSEELSTQKEIIADNQMGVDTRQEMRRKFRNYEI